MKDGRELHRKQQRGRKNDNREGRENDNRERRETEKRKERMMKGRGRESDVEEFSVWDQRIRLTPKQVISRGWSRKKSVSVVELNE